MGNGQRREQLYLIVHLHFYDNNRRFETSSKVSLGTVALPSDQVLIVALVVVVSS